MADRFIYKINENNEVEIWDNENLNEGGEPNIHQPFSTETGLSFADNADAVAWAEKCIDGLLNPPVVEAPVTDAPTA
jgi:hypothetical protein